MRQLLLDLKPSLLPTLAGFVTGRNAELLAALKETDKGRFHERFLYLWGEPGAGKSHLLRALAAAHGTFLPSSADARLDIALIGAPLLAVDDVHFLSDAAAVDLFNIYNEMRES